MKIDFNEMKEIDSNLTHKLITSFPYTTNVKRVTSSSDGDQKDQPRCKTARLFQSLNIQCNRSRSPHF